MGTPVVRTTSGPVRRRRAAHGTEFLGVPYAAPPVSALRFAPPRPHEPWTEVRDAGTTPFSLVLDQQPADAVRGGIDLLIGTNLHEGSLYLRPDEDVPTLAARFHERPDDVVRRHRAERPNAAEWEPRTAVLGEGLLGAGTRRLADAHAATGSPTFVREFTWRSDALDGRFGAGHVVELPFVFDRVDLPSPHGPNALLGTTAPPADLATRTHRARVDFATTGDPGWPRSEPGRRVVRRIGSTWDLVGQPHHRPVARRRPLDVPHGDAGTPTIAAAEVVGPVTSGGVPALVDPCAARGLGVQVRTRPGTTVEEPGEDREPRRWSWSGRTGGRFPCRESVPRTDVGALLALGQVGYLGDERLGRGQPPRLEHEFREFVHLDPVEVDDHPAEPARGELRLEHVRAFGHEGELFGHGLLQADRARARPVVAEPLAAHAERAVLLALRARHVDEPADDLEELVTVHSHRDPQSTGSAV